MLKCKWPLRRPFFINPRRGEVAGVINGTPHRLRLSLSALAYLESLYDGQNILVLTKQFAQNGLSARDVYYILQAGLFGAHYTDHTDHNKELSDRHIDVEGGFEAASQMAAQLLERAFATD